MNERKEKKIENKDGKKKNAILLGLFGILIFIFLIAYTFADCPDAYLSLITTQPTAGVPFSIKLVVTSGTPIKPWGNYSNASLTASPSSYSIVGETPPVESNGFVNLSNWSKPFVWQINATQPGSYEINVTLTNSTASCVETINVNVARNVGIPNLIVNIEDIGNIEIGENKQFNVTLKNSGSGDAIDIRGYFSAIGVRVSPNSISENILNNNTEKNETFTLRGEQCGNTKLTFDVSYKDRLGRSYNASDEEFVNVIGSDLVPVEFWANDYSLEEGDQVIFYVKIRNVNRNNYNIVQAKNVKATVYVAGNAITNSTTISIDPDNYTIIRIVWNKAHPKGTFIPKVVVTSDNECGNWQNNEKYLQEPLVIKESEAEEKEKEEGAGAGEGAGGAGGAGTTYIETKETKEEKEEKFEIVEIKSDDGLVILRIFSNTIVLLDGKEIDVKSIQIEKLEINLLPSLPEGIYLMRAYKINADSFSKEAELIFKFSKSELQKDANVFIYVYSDGRWQKLDAFVDKDKGIAKVNINKGGLYALFTDKIGTVPIASAVGVWFKENWWIVVSAVLGVIIVVSSIILIIRAFKH